MSEIAVNAQEISTSKKRFGLCKTLPYKKWRAFLKKMKRQVKRQVEAQARDTAEAATITPEMIAKQEYQDRQQEILAELEEKERNNQHQLWQLREKQAQLDFQRKKEWEEMERKKKDREEFLIRQEWEEKQKKEKEEEEKKKVADDEKKKKQESLLKEATKNERVRFGDGDWHNPIAPTGLVLEREKCTFFLKVGACRFGDRCSREHPAPSNSCTLLIPGFYSHFELDQDIRDECVSGSSNDLGLEIEESEKHEHYEDFFHDVLPEFELYGQVVQFVVCANYEPHLRGNVYVQFATESQAEAAWMKFNGRFYASRQLSCQFCHITNWKNAICGLYHRQKCPKGKHCNFIHAFKNPNGAFSSALYSQDYSRGPCQHSSSSDRQRRSRMWTPDSSRSWHRSLGRRDHGKKDRSSSRRGRSRSPGSVSPPPRSDGRHPWYRARGRHRGSQTRSKSRSPRSVSPVERSSSRSTQGRVRSKVRSRSPRERSRSPRHRSRSPRERSKSPRERSSTVIGQSGSPGDRSPTDRPRSHRQNSRTFPERSKSHPERSRPHSHSPDNSTLNQDLNDKTSQMTESDVREEDTADIARSSISRSRRKSQEQGPREKQVKPKKHHSQKEHKHKKKKKRRSPAKHTLDNDVEEEPSASTANSHTRNSHSEQPESKNSSTNDLIKQAIARERKAGAQSTTEKIILDDSLASEVDRLLQNC